MILPSASPSTWLLALVTAAAYAIGAAVASRSQASRSHLAMAPAWALHAGAIGWSQLGGAPHFGFAAALSMTAWLVLTIYALERELFPQMRTRWALGALAGVAVLLAALFPGRPLHATASPWMPLHLTLGIACYGLFAARCAKPDDKPFTRMKAPYLLPKTNPFLRTLFGHIAGPDLDPRIAWAVDDLAERFNVLVSRMVTTRMAFNVPAMQVLQVGARTFLSVPQTLSRRRSKLEPALARANNQLMRHELDLQLSEGGQILAMAASGSQDLSVAVEMVQKIKAQWRQMRGAEPGAAAKLLAAKAIDAGIYRFADRDELDAFLNTPRDLHQLIERYATKEVPVDELKQKRDVRKQAAPQATDDDRD